MLLFIDDQKSLFFRLFKFSRLLSDMKKEYLIFFCEGIKVVETTSNAYVRVSPVDTDSQQS